MSQLPDTTQKELSQEYIRFKPEIDEAISRVLVSGRYILGEEVEKFEESFAKYTGARHVVAVGNGYDAIYLSLLATGAKHEIVNIIGSPKHFAQNAVISSGGTPIYDDYTGNHPSIFIHSPLDKEPKIPYNIIVEDACQTIGRGCRNVGNLGLATCYSFHPLKKLHCYGDGGAITTNVEAVYQRLLRLRNHGRIGRTQVYSWGVNSRLDEIQAAVLNVFMKHIEEVVSDSSHGS